MSRTQGAKNKGRTVEQLIKEIEVAATKEGVKFRYDIEQVGDAAAKIVEEAGGDEDEQANARMLARSKFQELNIEVEENEEVDTFECGSCHAELASALPTCPECNSPLNW